MPAVSKINPDLQEERDKVEFNVDEFTRWYYNGDENVAQKRELERYFLSDPELNLEFDTSYLSYKEKYEEAIRRNVIIYRKLMKLLMDTNGDRDKYLDYLRNNRFLQSCINKDGDPFLLQFSMFGFMMMNLTNDEQAAEWLPRIINCQILGTYAQTELGHGSNLKGLETTATYDPKTQEFVINTPTLTAYKWWPGNMGHTVNYSVVMAQLHSLGKCHGIHPFIVQLRDEETHRPLAGITIGDIGNKLGYNTWNNGYVAFNNIRIPRKNMLMKSAEISKDGEFKRLRNSVSNYGAMVHMRVSIVFDTAILLAKAVTIATRYSIVRRQSPINPNEPEPKIIDHITQQYKIFPALARTIVYNISGNHLTSLLNKILMDSESSEKIAEFHVLTCGLKAIVTNDATKAIELCRLSCGGHGFLESSGLPNLYSYCTAGQTGEGENTVVLLQTAKFLIKSMNTIKNGEKVTSSLFYIVNYLNNKHKPLTFENSTQGILTLIKTAAAGTIDSAWKSIEEHRKYLSIEQATNQAGVKLVRAAELHCYAFLLEIAINELQCKKVPLTLEKVIENILELFAVDLALNLLGDILQFVSITNSDIEKLEMRLKNLLRYFRVNAIGIVDGFDFSDNILGSTLGTYDGNVYEKLFESAKKSPLNQEDVNKSFHLYLKPFMKSNL